MTENKGNQVILHVGHFAPLTFGYKAQVLIVFVDKEIGSDVRLISDGEQGNLADADMLDN